MIKYKSYQELLLRVNLIALYAISLNSQNDNNQTAVNTMVTMV